jgi:hypothetical protein
MLRTLLSGTYNHADKHKYFCDLAPQHAKQLFITQFKKYRLNEAPFNSKQPKESVINYWKRMRDEPNDSAKVLSVSLLPIQLLGFEFLSYALYVAPRPQALCPSTQLDGG